MKKLAKVDRKLLSTRNIVENFFSWIKSNRRIQQRYDKFISNYKQRVFICKECCDRECSNKAICRYTNRDVNGSKNILKAYWSEFRTSERPEYLKRGQPAPQERAGGPGRIRKRGKKLSEPTTQTLNEKIV